MDNPLEMKIIYFNAGKENKIELSKSDQKKISQILIRLFSKCTEGLSLYINEDRIKEIKKNNSGAEIILGKAAVFKTKSLGNYRINKLMIPFSGDFIGNEKAPVITIFGGEKEYFTPALINHNGLDKVKELENIIRTASAHQHK
jgi:hypothetical protein